MSPYRLTHDVWLAKEVERAKRVLLVHLDPEQEYTIAELLSLLSSYGLHYSNPEYLPIGLALIGEGILEVAP